MICDKSLVFFNVGFHGDLHLIRVISTLIEECEYFIETGTNVGSTLAFVAQKYPHMQCFSCEPNEAAFQVATANTADFPNVTLFNKMSTDFFPLLIEKDQMIVNKKILFWLDAHGRGYDFPIFHELEFITSRFKNAYIFIDDLKVPGLTCFAYEKMNDRDLSFAAIRNAIKSTHVRLFYPDYTEKTSQHHPLVGWGLMVIGAENHDLLSGLKGIIREERLASDIDGICSEESSL